jgi:hypothetical protein
VRQRQARAFAQRSWHWAARDRRARKPLAATGSSALARIRANDRHRSSFGSSPGGCGGGGGGGGGPLRHSTPSRRWRSAGAWQQAMDPRAGRRASTTTSSRTTVQLSKREVRARHVVGAGRPRQQWPELLWALSVLAPTAFESPSNGCLRASPSRKKAIGCFRRRACTDPRRPGLGTQRRPPWAR